MNRQKIGRILRKLGVLPSVPPPVQPADPVRPPPPWTSCISIHAELDGEMMDSRGCSRAGAVEAKGALTALMERPDFEEFLEELFRKAMPRERTIFVGEGAVYNANDFHTKAYISKTWGWLFEVLDIVPTFSSFQDGVVLKKR